MRGSRIRSYLHPETTRRRPLLRTNRPVCHCVSHHPVSSIATRLLDISTPAQVLLDVNYSFVSTAPLLPVFLDHSRSRTCLVLSQQDFHFLMSMRPALVRKRTDRPADGSICKRALIGSHARSCCIQASRSFPLLEHRPRLQQKTVLGFVDHDR